MPDRSYSEEEIIERIISLYQEIYNFWRSPEGWAPENAFGVLTRSRLDRQLSLTKQLKEWLKFKGSENDGALILAWVNLGSIIEGIIALALSVFYDSYQEERVVQWGEERDPDELALGKLREFSNGKLWSVDSEWDDWIFKVQTCRNAIHAYRDREIYDFDEFFQEIEKYYDFLNMINDRLPYPDM